MNKYDCSKKIKNLYAHAMQEMNSYVKEYVFSTYGIRVGDIILYEPHYNWHGHPYYLYVEEITSNIISVVNDGADLFINLKGPHVDEDGFKITENHIVVRLDSNIDPDRLLEITDILYQGSR